jgi:hypothetical protein
VGLHGPFGQEQPAGDLPVGQIVRDEPGYFELPAAQHGIRSGFGGRHRLRSGLVVHGEGDTLVDRHRAAPGVRHVKRSLADPPDDERHRPFVLLAVQLDQRQ